MGWVIDIIRKGLEMDHVLQYIALSKLRSGRQCSINQHLSDYVTGTFSKSKDICLVLGFLWCYVTCLRGMDIKKCVFLTVNVFRREFFIRLTFRVLAIPLWAYR